MAKRNRAHRVQKILAIVLLVCMVVSGLAVYAAATLSQPTQQPTQQTR